MRRGHVAERSCRGCGRKGPQSTMIRLSLSAGALVEDQGKRLPGKGIYCCDQQECRACMAKKARKVLRLDCGAVTDGEKRVLDK